jgi:hypothetical protein
MATDFRRTYHVNAEGGLYAVDSWTTPGGERIERRTTDITEEDARADRRDIEMAYLDHENEQAEQERQRIARPRRRG